MAIPDYQQHGSAPPAAPHAIVPVGRPTTLAFGYIAGLVAGLFSIIGALLLISGARQVAEDTTASVLSGTSLDGSDLAQGVVDEATNTLVVRGTMGLVFGALVVLLALAARHGARWARIGLALGLLCLVGVNAIIVGDVTPSGTKAFGVVAMLLSAVVVIAIFLPSTNRYAKARRRASV